MNENFIHGCYEWMEEPHPFMKVSSVNVIHGWRNPIHGWYPRMRIPDDGHGWSQSLLPYTVNFFHIKKHNKSLCTFPSQLYLVIVVLHSIFVFLFCFNPNKWRENALKNHLVMKSGITVFAFEWGVKDHWKSSNELDYWHPSS